MEWLLGWLQNQLAPGQAWRFILICEALDFVWCFIVTAILYFCRIELSENTMKYSRSSILQWSFPFRLLKAATREELLFRFLPLVAAVSIWGATWPTVVVALVSSIIFGRIHGNNYNILIQGVSGLIFSVIFLKCGGLSYHFFQALFWSTVAHCLANSLVAIIVASIEKNIQKKGEENAP